MSQTKLRQPKLQSGQHKDLSLSLPLSLSLSLSASVRLSRAAC